MKKPNPNSLEMLSTEKTLALVRARKMMNHVIRALKYIPPEMEVQRKDLETARDYAVAAYKAAVAAKESK